MAAWRSIKKYLVVLARKIAAEQMPMGMLKRHPHIRLVWTADDQAAFWGYGCRCAATT
jgi:hypothetical protein